MKLFNWICIDVKRIWHNGHMLYVLLGSILFGLTALSTMPDLTYPNSVCYCMQMTTEDFIYLLSFMPAFFAYGCCFMDDFRYHYIRQEMLESRLLPYVVSKTLIIFFSAVITLGIGTGGCSLILGFFKEWGNPVDEILNILSTPYANFARHGNVVILFTVMGLQLGLLAGILSLFSALLSLFIENRILAGTATTLIGMVLQFAGTRSDKLNIYQLFTGLENFEFQGEYWIEKCLLLSSVCYILCTILIYIKIKRRLHSE